MKYLNLLSLILLISLSISSLSQTMNTASSTSGIAPFAVFFDAVDAASGVVQPPLENGRSEYADLYYSWDFGDSNSGEWFYSQHSKNHDIGYNACHVYDTPGNYTVTLTVTDLLGNTYTYTQNIEVLDPDPIFAGEKTTCVSSTGNFEGAPEGSLHLTTTNLRDIEPHIATGNRILLCRGDSWTVSEGMLINSVPGPFVLGAYGLGVNKDEYGIYTNAPLIVLTGNQPDGSFIDYWNVNNWQIMDLHFVGDLTYHGAIGGGVGECSNMLHYRMHFEGFSTPVGTSHWETDGHDRWMLISSKVHDTQGMVVYTGSERLVVMGNLLYNSYETHILRVWQAYKGVISHNYCHGSSLHTATGRHALKFHGPSEETIASSDEAHLEHRTQYAVVYDNIFGTCGPWQVPIAPQDGISDERLSDILVECNRFLAGYGSISEQSNRVFVGLHLRADYVTVRNNVFDGTGSGRYWGAIDVDGTDFKSSVGNRIFNNTIAKHDYPEGDEPYITFTGFVIGGGAENTRLQNNLMHIKATNLDVENDYEDAGTNSTINNNLLTSEDCFRDADNENILLHDYRLVDNCVAIDGGTPVSIFHDFDLITRPNGATIDLGAFELSNFIPDFPDLDTANFEGAEFYVYPNPFHVDPNISLHAESTFIVKITIYNMRGQKVLEFTQNIYEGENDFETDELNNLEQGVYYIVLQTPSGAVLKTGVVKL